MTAALERGIEIRFDRIWSMKSSGEHVKSYSICFDEKRIGTLDKFPECWLATIFGKSANSATGSGSTPAAAMENALTSGIEEMALALGSVKAVAVEHGDELLAAAEGIQ